MDSFQDWLNNFHWGDILTLLIGSSLLTTVITHVLTDRSVGVQSRRRGYADALAALVAWYEYPYRIKRRTADDAVVLASLVDRGHDLQERLAATQMWVQSESNWVGEVFNHTRRQMDLDIGPLCKDAWNSMPIATASEMAIGDWGPASLNELIEPFEAAVRWRFGWRRLVPGGIAGRRAA